MMMGERSEGEVRNGGLEVGREWWDDKSLGRREV